MLCECICNRLLDESAFFFVIFGCSDHYIEISEHRGDAL
jgi:hypothetical protein